MADNQIPVMAGHGELLPAPAVVDGTVSAKSRTHITHEGWQQHKERIATLYVTESKTLSEVRQIMEIEHSFLAS